MRTRHDIECLLPNELKVTAVAVLPTLNTNPELASRMSFRRVDYPHESTAIWWSPQHKIPGVPLLSLNWQDFKALRSITTMCALPKSPIEESLFRSGESAIPQQYCLDHPG
jgi:hypothetical protein